MSITFAWSIKKLEVDPALNDKVNVVTTVSWNVMGTDGDISESHSGSRSFLLGDTFVPYDQLTEQQVLDWCFEPEIVEIKDFGSDAVIRTTFDLKQNAEKQVTNQIEKTLAQKAIEPALPWA
jgi:hypothetical protein